MTIFRQAIKGNWCVLVTDSPFDPQMYDVWLAQRGYMIVMRYDAGFMKNGVPPDIDCDKILDRADDFAKDFF